MGLGLGGGLVMGWLWVFVLCVGLGFGLCLCLFGWLFGVDCCMFGLGFVILFFVGVLRLVGSWVLLVLLCGCLICCLLFVWLCDLCACVGWWFNAFFIFLYVITDCWRFDRLGFVVVLVFILVVMFCVG